MLTGALCFFLALLSKETGITFLVIIPLTIFVFGETNKRRLIYSGLTLLGITLIYLGLRQSVSNHRPVTDGIGMMDNFLIYVESYSQVFASAIYVLLRYVILLIFPHPLSSDYSYAQIEVKTFNNPLVIFGLLLFAGATTFSTIMIRKKNKYAYAILFFLITIFPVSNIPFLIGSSMAERFLYIPSLGFCILITLLLVKLTRTLWRSVTFNSFGQFFKKYQLLLTITAALAIIYSIKTIFRSRDWQDNLALFRAASKTSPKSARVHYSYGGALFNDALNDKSPKPDTAGKFEQAKKEYETALAIFPQYANAYTGLGLFYKNKADFKNSVDNFEKAKAYTPQPKSILYRELGYGYLKTGQFEKSIAALDSFLLLDIETSSILNFKGSALFGLLKYPEALQAYLKASDLNPNDVDILKNIGRTYYNLKQYDKAASYFKRCVDMQPNNSENYKFLGLTYQVMGDMEKANLYLAQYEKMRSGQK